MPGIHSPADFSRLRRQAGFSTPLLTFVETGTYHGDTLAAAITSGEFAAIHSVEISAVYHEAAIRKWRDYPAVHLHLGDSAEIVPHLATTLDGSVFWFLDAHWWQENPPVLCPQDKLPLWHELAALRSRDCAELVIVDDIHVFGGADSRVPAEWRGVTCESILCALGDRAGGAFADEWRYVIPLRAGE